MVECCAYNYNGLQLFTAFFSFFRLNFVATILNDELHHLIMKTWLGLNFFAILNKSDHIQGDKRFLSVLGQHLYFGVIVKSNFISH